MKPDSKTTLSDTQDANDCAQMLDTTLGNESIIADQSAPTINLNEPEISDESITTESFNKDDAEHLAPSQAESRNTRHLYNDVTFEPEHLDASSALEFSIEDATQETSPAERTAEQFTVTDDQELLQKAIDTIPAMHAEPKLMTEQEDVRREPQLRETQSFSEDHFSAVADQVAVPAEPLAMLGDSVENPTQGGEEENEVTAQDKPPVKKQRGSKLGMGWFQGFSLFVAFLIFSALAVFAYFMLGDKPLYEGDVPKYVVIGNEDSGAMAALNPAIPEEVRQQYIYVPKVTRTEDLEILQERPVLDTTQDAKVTKVELASNTDGSEEVVVSEESVETNSGSVGLELLSVDHNAAGLSAEDLALVDGFLLQGDIAYEQGIYVGVNQDDAYHYYQSALAIDPNNAQAQQGIANIANVYYASARDAYNYGTYDVAAQYVALGLAVQPNHSSLLQLQQLVEQMQSTQSPNVGAQPNYDSFNFDF
ncbi:hypothetical protein DC083_03880 [Ignatzschineria ureiclastica]|uniref:Tetratricopeptide repeat protein n=1 Tax=Ignatzschineria ureiclastica TaxID=472582 RepID=A0A2U2AFZ2_9GAMM|nr:hypothetical protein [Ignatzschineria ureiclastica]PWD81584.1 hypothetical protein DC083_03880 [Ignatzschineria ureiclastica]